MASAGAMIDGKKRAKALAERLVPGVRWRLAAFGNRVRAQHPHLMPVLRELRATTKKPIVELTRGLLAATLGWDVALASSGCLIIDGNPNWGSGRQLCRREGVRPILAGMFPEYFR